jgi:hypothetical protein
MSETARRARQTANVKAVIESANSVLTTTITPGNFAAGFATPAIVESARSATCRAVFGRFSNTSKTNIATSLTKMQ